MPYLIDTNVVSELRKKAAATGMWQHGRLAWSMNLFSSALSA
jgi:predicted nucleic acid-binding protein